MNNWYVKLEGTVYNKCRRTSFSDCFHCMLMWIKVKPCFYWPQSGLSRRRTRVFRVRFYIPRMWIQIYVTKMNVRKCESGCESPMWTVFKSHIISTALLFVQHCKPWPASWFREFGECWNTRKRHYKFWSCQLYISEICKKNWTSRL